MSLNNCSEKKSIRLPWLLRIHTLEEADIMSMIPVTCLRGIFVFWS